MVIWLGFEAVIAPLLGLPRTRSRPLVWRAVMAADHVLYGTVVGGRLAPAPAAQPG